MSMSHSYTLKFSLEDILHCLFKIITLLLYQMHSALLQNIYVLWFYQSTRMRKMFMLLLFSFDVRSHKNVWFRWIARVDESVGYGKCIP